MPYAANGTISQSPIEGGIEISNEQYLAALDGMLAGMVVSIDGGFSVKPPPEPEPEPTPEPEGPEPVLAVSRLQGILALDAAGLLDAVEDVVNHPDTPRQVRLAWQHALTFERHSQALQWLAEQAGITEQQLDDLFAAAAQIQA